MIKKFKNLIQKEFVSLFATPAFLLQALFLFLPLLGILIASFSSYAQTGDFLTGWTLKFYTDLITPTYFFVILNSFLLSFVTTTICLLVAYPVAYFLAMRASQKARATLIFLLILPSWTNFILQAYSWFFVLSKNSFLSKLLFNTGLFSTPPHMLNNFFSTVVGMVYCFLPFMVLPIFAVIEKMDKRLLEASADLGAGKFETFRKVILPLSMSGIYAGCLLVFVPSFGEFAIPTILGGGKKVYWGNVIVEKLLVSKDWSSGFAFAVIGVIALILFSLFIFLLRHTISAIFGYKRYVPKHIKAKETNWWGV